MIEKIIAFLKENGVELPDNLSNDDLMTILATLVNADDGSGGNGDENKKPEEPEKTQALGVK